MLEKEKEPHKAALFLMAWRRRPPLEPARLARLLRGRGGFASGRFVGCRFVSRSSVGGRVMRRRRGARRALGGFGGRALHMLPRALDRLMRLVGGLLRGASGLIGDF